MGKGAGVCGSKPQAVSDPPVQRAVEPPVQRAVEPVAITTPAPVAEATTMVKIYVVFYSMYGHIYKLAQAIKEGIDSVDGCEAILYQVRETLPEEVLSKMHAPPKPDVPIIDPHDLPNADGLMFGFPTRYGRMVSQMAALWDATGGLWMSGGLVGKPAGMFTSTASQGGGQESTILTSMGNLVHHGMIFVPPGYTFPKLAQNVDTVRGGSPWGAGTFAGAQGGRQPSEEELEYAVHQGAYFAKVTKRLSVKGE